MKSSTLRPPKGYAATAKSGGCAPTTTVATVCRWTMSKAACACRRFPIRCCASTFGGRFCPPTRHSAPIFTGSVHGPATGVESPLHPVATGRNTARNAAAPSDASRRRTLPDGGAASNIKRRESLNFRGFFEGKAGAGGRFHPPPLKSTSNILQRRIL